MVHSNVRKGFSFIEVIISLAMMGILLVSLFALQQASMQASFTSTNILRRILLLKNTLYDPAFVRENHDQELKKEQKIKEPATTIKLVMNKPTIESLKNLELERIRAQASWDDIMGKQDESLLFIKFVRPEPKGRS